MGPRARASRDGAVKFHRSLLSPPARESIEERAEGQEGRSGLGKHRGAPSARAAQRGTGDISGSLRGAWAQPCPRRGLCVPAVTSVPPRQPPQRGFCADAAALPSDMARQRCSSTHSGAAPAPSCSKNTSFLLGKYSFSARRQRRGEERCVAGWGGSDGHSLGVPGVAEIPGVQTPPVPRLGKNGNKTTPAAAGM